MHQIYIVFILLDFITDFFHVQYTLYCTVRHRIYYYIIIYYYWIGHHLSFFIYAAICKFVLSYMLYNGIYCSSAKKKVYYIYVYIMCIYMYMLYLKSR